MTTRPSETRRPAVGAAGQEQQSGTRLFLVIENHDLRQRWQPTAPTKKKINVTSPRLAAYLFAMAQEGGRYE